MKSGYLFQNIIFKINNKILYLDECRRSIISRRRNKNPIKNVFHDNSK